MDRGTVRGDMYRECFSSSGPVSVPVYQHRWTKRMFLQSEFLLYVAFFFPSHGPGFGLSHGVMVLTIIGTGGRGGSLPLAYDNVTLSAGVSSDRLFVTRSETTVGQLRVERGRSIRLVRGVSLNFLDRTTPGKPICRTCSTNPCQFGGTCTDLDFTPSQSGGQYFCTCVAGYSGTTCQTNINGKG